MSRTTFSFHSDDISALARSLVKQWSKEANPPGHLQMLNMLARAAGFQNFQHFRADAEATLSAVPKPATQSSVAPLIEQTGQPNKNVQRLLRHFDLHGRLMRWPSKFSEQQPCLWPIWARIPARRDLTERQVNEAIKLGESFGDHVLIRRELVNYRMLMRTKDGAVYRRVEQPLPTDIGNLVHEVLQRIKIAA
jgi:hypothetical protein